MDLYLERRKVLGVSTTIYWLRLSALYTVIESRASLACSEAERTLLGMLVAGDKIDELRRLVSSMVLILIRIQMSESLEKV